MSADLRDDARQPPDLSAAAALPAEEALRLLGSRTEGLSASEAEQRLALVGRTRFVATALVRLRCRPGNSATRCWCCCRRSPGRGRPGSEGSTTGRTAGASAAGRSLDALSVPPPAVDAEGALVPTRVEPERRVVVGHQRRLGRRLVISRP